MRLSADFIDEALVRFARGTRVEFARYIEQASMDLNSPTTNLRESTEQRVAILEERLERIIGMCDVPPHCACGRPNGLGAVVACAKRGRRPNCGPL